MSWKVKILGSDNAYINNTSFDIGADITIDSGASDYVSGLTATILNTSTTRVISAINKTTSVFTTSGSISNNQIVIFSGSSTVPYYNFLVGNFYILHSVSGSTFKLKALSFKSSIKIIELDNFGVKPFLIDESEKVDYYGGGFRNNKTKRLGFQFTPKQFRTKGSAGTIHTNSQYWDLMEILYKRGVFILDFGSEFERITNLHTKYPTIFTAPAKPILFELLEISELSDNFQNNHSSMNFTLAVRDIFIT